MPLTCNGDTCELEPRKFNELKSAKSLVFGRDGQSFVVINGSDDMPVLFVRVRSEYCETELQAILRAKRITEKLNS